MSARDYVGLYDSYSSIGAEFWIVTIVLVLAVVINIGHIVYVVYSNSRHSNAFDTKGVVRITGSLVIAVVAILGIVYMPSINKRKSESSKKAMTEYNVGDMESLGKNIKYLNKKIDELKKEYSNLEGIIGKKSVYHPPVRYKLGTTYHTRPGYYTHRLDSEKFINYTLELWYNGDVADLSQYFKGLNIDKLAIDLNNNLVH
jgi:hypothetical protein